MQTMPILHIRIGLYGPVVEIIDMPEEQRLNVKYTKRNETVELLPLPDDDDRVEARA